jgi:hypothetical protein
VRVKRKICAGDCRAWLCNGMCPVALFGSGRLTEAFPVQYFCIRTTIAVQLVYISFHSKILTRQVGAREAGRNSK